MTAQNKPGTITVRGVTFTPDPHLADDWEILEQVANVDEGDVTATAKLFRRVFGDAYDAVKEAIRGERGYVSTQDMVDALTEVMSALPKLAS